MNWPTWKKNLFTTFSNQAPLSSLPSVPRTWSRWRTLRNRALGGVLILLGLFLLYRAVWLTGWYWPYRMLRGYLTEQLPMAAPWALETFALLLATLIAAQAAAIFSFVFFGKHKREMLYLSLAAALIHGMLGWYSYGRVVVDEQGRVNLRVVERPDGTLKVLSRPVDPETGRRTRLATEADLVMLDLQRRGLSVQKVGPQGPFRTAQGTIHVFWTRQAGRIVLYTGPRHPDVSGDMPRATDAILHEFRQEFLQPR
jgi:hypothetical protein